MASAPAAASARARTVAGSAKAVLRRAGVSRRNAAALRMCCERNIRSFSRPTGGDRPRILCYHSIGTPAWGVNDVSPARFRRHIELALAMGYEFVPANDIASGQAAGRKLAITFDDGLRSVAEHAAPILRDFGVPWTLFVVTGLADGRHGFGDVMLSWREIEQLAAAGAEIASHSVSHPNFGRLPAGEAEAEIAGSREALRSRIGIVPDTFAIPFGQSRDWTAGAHAAALRAGYRYVFAQSEERRFPGTVARTFVTHFDSDRVFRAALHGAFDRWEEWV
ncbi:MAG: polysaccharide deacetylase family protein [Hyphomicrobiales bacterium]